MRSSRISQDTAKLFERVSGPVSPPRRTTRSSSLAARFAHTTAATRNGTETTTTTPDIEDAITDTTKAIPVRKRRRVASSPTTTIKGDEARRMKEEEEEEEEGEGKEEEEEEGEDSMGRKKKNKRKSRKPARKVVDPKTGDATTEPPSDWESTYQVVREMRQPGGAAYGAAVDTMGCERLADRTASPRDQRFHTLIALMLSSQTKDTVNAVVMARLKSELPACEEGAPPGLNLENVLAVEPDVLNHMIWAVGFHNNKTKTAEILRDEWKGDIPDSIEGMMSLPGVGPKMAYLCMSHAWDRTEGIGVDVHVHRITNLWGWNKTRTPEETRLSLQSWLPHDRWREINGLLVGLGQSVCLPQGSKCGDCELGLRGMCRAADRKKVNEGRTRWTRRRRSSSGGDDDASSSVLPGKKEEEEGRVIKSEPE
ncbi:endonuclease III [Geosmithia morbida]|uniref:Endonuclease III homolog n=1 Tax=Geosmithia morbida TaxID=1094350 RepID=A0A9P4Z145_9HYPO|nr:endonuclease III [Geosmithia morbida]KAF4125770.1 endonuclease III [Geosmithia morbida]